LFFGIVYHRAKSSDASMRILVAHQLRRSGNQEQR